VLDCVSLLLALQMLFGTLACRSFTEQYFDSCGSFRDAVISIAATLAKQERLKISERTMAGLT
jgi:DNA invertase Pin-like site-specific DNA recombinase